MMYAISIDWFIILFTIRSIETDTSEYEILNDSTFLFGYIYYYIHKIWNVSNVFIFFKLNCTLKEVQYLI